jgi:hypothetical protein
MPNLVITARIVKHADGHFVAIVSSAPAGGGDNSTTRTDSEMADAPTCQEAITKQNRLVGAIVDRALRRGDVILKVQRLPGAGPLFLWR